MCCKKSQAAIEFLIVFSIILFIFSVLILFFYENVLENESEKKVTLMKDIATGIREEIILAQGASDGYNRTFFIANKINNKDYDLNFSDNLLIIDFQGARVSYPILNFN